MNAASGANPARHQKFFRILGLAAVVLLNSLALASLQTVNISISPTYAAVQLGQQVQFSAIVKGTGNSDVTWQVDNAKGGNSTAGTISSTGVYAAPSTMPSVASATVTVVSRAESLLLVGGNRLVVARGACCRGAEDQRDYGNP